MNYLSPFHILPDGIEIENLTNKKVLKQARKLVLAEFELQGTTTIIINNQAFDKDAVLKYFEALEKDTNLHFHAEIYNNKALLSFLETSDIHTYKAAVIRIENIQYKREDDGFLSFIAPYFTQNFSELFAKAIRQNDILVLDILLEKEFPLPQRFEVNAYQSVYRWYYSKLRIVESIEQKLGRKEFVLSNEINDLIDFEFIETFNRLPTYFYNIRDRYAFQLYEIVVLLNNEFKRISLARAIVDAGLLFKVEHATMQYFKEAARVIESENKKAGRFNWIWLYVIFQAILIISRISTCDNSSSSDTYDFKPFNYSYIVPEAIEDSIFKAVTDERKEDNRKLDSLMKELNLNRKKIEAEIDSLDRR